MIRSPADAELLGKFFDDSIARADRAVHNTREKDHGSDQERAALLQVREVLSGASQALAQQLAAAMPAHGVILARVWARTLDLIAQLEVSRAQRASLRPFRWHTRPTLRAAMARPAAQEDEGGDWCPGPAQRL